MKALDEAHWSLLKHKMLQDSTGESWVQFVELWTTSAERIIDEEGYDPHIALNKGLALAEEELGTLHPDFFGNMLVLIVGMWAHRDGVLDELTPLERKALEGYTLEQTKQLAAEAAGEVGQSGV